MLDYVFCAGLIFFKKITKSSLFFIFCLLHTVTVKWVTFVHRNLLRLEYRLCEYLPIFLVHGSTPYLMFGNGTLCRDEANVPAPVFEQAPHGALLTIAAAKLWIVRSLSRRYLRIFMHFCLPLISLPPPCKRRPLKRTRYAANDFICIACLPLPRDVPDLLTFHELCLFLDIQHRRVRAWLLLPACLAKSFQDKEGAVFCDVYLHRAKSSIFVLPILSSSQWREAKFVAWWGCTIVGLIAFRLVFVRNVT